MTFGPFNETSSIQPMAEINVTPMVDVMLVLLVIFIITAPLFQQAVSIDLPKVDSSSIEEAPLAVDLAIDAAGEIYVDGRRTEAAQLEARLRAANAANKQPVELHLRAERATRYERVTEVMAAAQRVGIGRIAFVTEPATARQSADDDEARSDSGARSRMSPPDSTRADGLRAKR